MIEPDSQSLSGVVILEGLDANEFTSLAKDARWKRYQAGEQIIDQESYTSDVFFVVSGRVRVVNYSAAGREITLDEVKTGGHFGELSAIDKRPRSASVLVLEDSMLASLNPDRFIQLMMDHPRIAVRMMQAMAQIIRNSTERIMDLSTLAANNRVQAELLSQAREVAGEDAPCAEISPIPVHWEIASRVSTTRETVARVFSDLTRQGLVKRQKDRLVITDLEELEHMVEAVRG